MKYYAYDSDVGGKEKVFFKCNYTNDWLLLNSSYYIYITSEWFPVIATGIP